MPMESTSMCSNTLYMSNMDVRSTLKWMTASTVTKWHHFHSISDQNPKYVAQLGQWNGMRVHPHALETAYQKFKNCIHI